MKVITEPGKYSITDIWWATIQGVRLYYDNSYIEDVDCPVTVGEQLVSLELTLADGRIVVVNGDSQIEARAVSPASEIGGK